LVFPGACLALLVAGAAVNPAVSYFWAADRPDIVLRAACLNAVTVVVASVALLPVLDLMAIGASLAAGAFAESLFFVPVLRRHLGATLLPTLPAPVAAASAGAAVGWVVATTNLPLVAAVVASGIVAGVITAALLALFSRAALVDLSRVAAKSVRHAFGAGDETPVGT
jgi:peptidoglycan biosynthesis protein MviN/MurJ (putative lipid II flippase)